MVAFCKVCGLGFHSLAGPGEDSVLEICQRAHQHFVEEHFHLIRPLALALLRLSAVVMSRALDWGQDSRDVEAVRAQLRSTLMTNLAWDGLDPVQPSP